MIFSRSRKRIFRGKVAVFQLGAQACVRGYITRSALFLGFKSLSNVTATDRALT